MDYLKVSSKSSPASVAGAIAGLIKDGLPVEIQSVGAGAVNQAIKAVAIARSFLIPAGVDVVCVPTFQDIEIDGERRTAIRLSVYPHLIAIESSASAASDRLKTPIPAAQPSQEHADVDHPDAMGLHEAVPSSIGSCALDSNVMRIAARF